MSPRVLQPSREELENRRLRLLKSAGITREDRDAAAESGTLAGDRYWALEDIRSIEFLFGDVDHGS